MDIQEKNIIIAQLPEKVNMTNLVEAVTKCMSLVGNIKKLSGDEKKDLVIDLITVILDKEYFDNYEVYIKILIPQMIDSMIKVENGKLKFNKQKLFSLFSCCR